MNKEKLKTLQTLTLFGSKFVVAYPMTRLEYNSLRNLDLPSDENGDDEGFMIENLTNAKPNTDFSEGYISWSTKEQVFLEFRETGNFPFGIAIEALKLGHCVSRSGWNGKGMFIYLNKGSVSKDPENDLEFTSIDGIESSLFENGNTGTITRLPNINMRSATGSIVTGWLASQTDILAEDWGIVELGENK